MTQQTKLLDKILSVTYQKPEALIHLQTLKDLILTRLFGGEKIELKSVTELPPSQKTQWLISLGADIYSCFDRRNVYKLFEWLEEEIKKIEPLIIFLPFNIPEEDLNQIGIYLRKDYGKRFLIEVKIDPHLLAGAAFAYKGIYKDYSLRRRIVQNRRLILQSFQEFLPSAQLPEGSAHAEN